MKEISLNEFCANSEAILRGAALDDEFVRVRVGKESAAVIINEDEWNILMEALAIVLKERD